MRAGVKDEIARGGALEAQICRMKMSWMGMRSRRMKQIGCVWTKERICSRLL